jgi:NADPH:quinone reductase
MRLLQTVIEEPTQRAVPVEIRACRGRDDRAPRPVALRRLVNASYMAIGDQNSREDLDLVLTVNVGGNRRRPRHLSRAATLIVSASLRPFTHTIHSKRDKSKMHAIVMREPGGPEVLELIERNDPVPGAGEALVEVAAAGVNFVDTGVRRGMFWTELNPKIIGVEGAGRVVSVGAGVDDIKPGQRVAWVWAPGSYAERIAVPAAALVPIPDAIDDRTAASIMMQGITASHFATDFYPVQPGDVALVHAAAGGLGLLLTQIIKLRGGTVIGRVSAENKVAFAKEAGADHVIVDAGGDFADEVLRLTAGEGVHVVYDGSGPATFQASLASLRRSGTFCWYASVLGGPGNLDIGSLPKSIKIGYAAFTDHVHTTELLRAHTEQLFDWISEGKLKVSGGKVYPLAEAGRAHADMESRASTGKLLLIP